MSDNPYLKPPLPVQIGPYVATLRIHRDERGVAWIDNSNIKVIEVILDHQDQEIPIVTWGGVTDKGKTIYPGTPVLLKVSNGQSCPR